ncbi:MAG: PSD1 and planctomycete cytochrome C domain-containing protein [Bacteroidota bacterium]
MGLLHLLKSLGNWIVFPFFLLFACQPTSSTKQTVDAEKLFAYEILPLLESKCFACHGGDSTDIKGELDMRTLAGLLKGGESGHSSLIPGNAEKSPVYLAATRQDPDFSMPPKDNDALTAEQIHSLYLWIEGNAPWPEAARLQALIEADDWDYGGKIKVHTSTARSQSWANRRYQQEDLWAFAPLDSPDVPDSRTQTHAIDAFVQKELTANGLKAAPLTDQRTLIRRATFDLTGLPPTPEEVEAFLTDDDPNAYERLLDRLLDSPHYGEQWGRHWLDVVRYADSDGFANDYARPNAWRYRDYVIRSFNEDKAYNQFVMEQIAGDEIDPSKPENLIATGFLRMGPWEHTGMAVEAETRQYFLDDVTNGVGESFLSLPLRCARCHDHKFDPIPTKDYYQIQAVFATTQFATRHADFLPSENLDRMEEERDQILEWLEEIATEEDMIREKEELAAKEWYRSKGKRYRTKGERRKLPQQERPPRYTGLTFQDLGYRKVLQKRGQTLRREMERFEPYAFSVFSGPYRSTHSGRPVTFHFPDKIEGPAESTFILTGGSVYTHEEEVAPGILSAIPALSIAQTPEQSMVVPPSMKGRRLAFAQWLTQADHPLTTRSIVNRIWQYHFGKGLAENSNNFGITGKKPSHPELLDWLANYFVQHNWSIKAMHRLIMTSETYRRSGKHPNPEQLAAIDPDNHWLALFSPRRLEAEEIRDAMLQITGELNPEMGGIPIRPEINQEVALQPRHIMGSIERAYQASRLPKDRHRRTIYALRKRNMPDPMLTVFNQAGSELSCERRTTSSVTPQAFTLFNSQNSHDRALALAVRMRAEYPSLDNQIDQAIRLVWNRAATAEEIRLSKAYLEQMHQYHEANPAVPQEYPTEIRREMFEEMTGESFEYVEQLDVFKDYVPDAKPWDVSSEARALADFALVLFNSNEFIYVY